MLPRSEQFQPAFVTLPTVDGLPNLRWVDGRLMDSEEFHACGYHVVDLHESIAEGTPVWSWMAELEGLRSYSRLTAQRRADARAAAIRRTEEDGSFRAYVDAIDDARPGR